MTSSDLKTEETAPETPKNPCEREVSVEVSAEAVTREWKTTLARFQKHARVPGFRTGKVPPTLIERKFAEDIKAEVIERLVPTAFRDETKRQNLVPIGQPKVTELELEQEKPLRFKAVFEVLPAFEVDGYKEVRTEIEPVAVSDDEVQKTLEGIREQSSTYVNMDEDRPLQDGDFASVSFKSTGQQEDAEPVSVDDALVEIGGASTLPPFTENLRGAKAGESRTFDVTCAEDSTEKRLAGKTLTYQIEVKAIKTKSIPELNDEWVKELGQEGLNTVDEMRARIREGMEHEKRHQAEHKTKDELLKKLVERFPIEVPMVMVEHAIDRRLERGLRSLISQGLRAEDIKRMDMSRLRDAQREGAKRDVQANLLLERIADAENIEVTDEQLDAEIAVGARQAGQNPLALRKELEEKDGLNSLRQQMRADRALDWLYAQSAGEGQKV